MMRLLLFLSAILSALAGAVTGARGASVTAELSRSAEVAAKVIRSTAAQPLRPHAALSGPAATARPFVRPAPAPAAASPLYASRRRE